jgi:hypothetical protein
MLDEDFLEMEGGEGCTALPDAFVLAANADPIFLLHLNNNPFTILDK